MLLGTVLLYLSLCSVTYGGRTLLHLSRCFENKRGDGNKRTVPMFLWLQKDFCGLFFSGTEFFESSFSLFNGENIRDDGGDIDAVGGNEICRSFQILPVIAVAADQGDLRAYQEIGVDRDVFLEDTDDKDSAVCTD